MIPLIRQEVVERRRWLAPEDFLDALAIAQSSPGPVAVNLAVFIGYRVAGAGGMAAAALGAVLPSFLVTLAVVILAQRFEYHPLVVRFFAAVRPAVLGLIAVATWDLARAALVDKRAWALGTTAFLLVLALGFHPGVVLAGGLLAGLVVFRRDAA